MKTTSFSNKSIAVLGAGESGEAAAILLHDLGAMITVLDTAEENKLRKRIDTLALESPNVPLFLIRKAERSSA